MPEELPGWPRPHYQKPGGRPFLFFVVYGAFGPLPLLDARTYRTRGISHGLELGQYSRARHPAVFAGFQHGYLWKELTRQDSGLAAEVADADQCLILRGDLDDRDNLDYLRDAVGMITFLLDHGGVCVFDPQMFKWWGPEPWRRTIFDPAAPVPRQHVIILHSQEEAEDGEGPATWYHTRGLRKFGRPDLSVHDVPQQHDRAIVDLLERFIELQALGGVIEDGSEIRMDSLPAGMICRHGGSLEDPEFNNVHVEISPPGGSR